MEPISDLNTKRLSQSNCDCTPAKVITSKLNLASHDQKSNLMNVSIRLKRIKIFLCHSCDRVFHSSDRLTNHRQSAHPKEIAPKAVINAALQDKPWISCSTDSQIADLQGEIESNIESEHASETHCAADFVTSDSNNLYPTSDENDKLKNKEGILVVQKPVEDAISESTFYNDLEFDAMEFMANHPDWASINQLPKPSDLAEIFQATNSLTLSEICTGSDFPVVDRDSNFIDNLTFIPGLKQYEQEQVHRLPKMVWYNQLFDSKESEYKRNGEKSSTVHFHYTFNCKICRRQFLTASGLENHTRRNHQNSSKSPKSTKKRVLQPNLKVPPCRCCSGTSTVPAPAFTEAPVSIPVHSPGTSAAGGQVTHLNTCNMMRERILHRKDISSRESAACQTVPQKKHPNGKSKSKPNPKKRQGNLKTCLLCKDKFSTRGGLTRHLLQTHFSEEEKLFECKICKSKFSFQTELKEHQASNHETNFRCSICQANFPTRWLCTEHETLHDKESNESNFVRDQWNSKILSKKSLLNK